jgi:squalene-hopene/tetraprenyl-beta-curcumene cyclase
MPSEVNVPDLPTLEELISSGTRALLNERHSDGHWCFELEADATIPAEYILLVPLPRGSSGRRP